MKNKTMFAYKKGFTLIELLVSISIIVILTMLASVSYSKAQKSGRDQRRIEDLRSIQNAAEQYYLLSGGSYPSNSTTPWKWPNTSTGQIVLQKFPLDPKNSGEYIYSASYLSGRYCVCAKVEDLKNSNSEAGCSFVNTGYFCVSNQQ